MNSAPSRIHLSLVSHTNVGKTTLARTLLSRDVGVVSDRAHVTQDNADYILSQTESGVALVLWDTPGFGNSVQLAKRLTGRENPIGWLTGEVWDRVANKTLWLNQKAVEHIRDTSNAVLYLVNASENPQTTPYIQAEMQILEWIGKPVIVLLNQLGTPKPREEEESQLNLWHSALKGNPVIRSVLPLDAFARCWVQEFVLFDAIAQALPSEFDDDFTQLRAIWGAERRRMYDQSLDAIAAFLKTMIEESETEPAPSLFHQVSNLVERIGQKKTDDANDPVRIAQGALASRAAEHLAALTDSLIAINGLKGAGIRKEILTRVKTDWDVSNPLDPTGTSILAAIGSGTLGGLVADLSTGGASLGLGALIGGVIGAIGGAGAAAAYNTSRGLSGTTLTWSRSALHSFMGDAILVYLAVSHFGRGRGDFQESEYPAHWEPLVREEIKKLSPLPGQMAGTLNTLVRQTLTVLYPKARF